MDITIPSKYIEQAVVKYESDVQHRVKVAPRHSKKLITISRQIGAGGRAIADKLGEILGCQVWGREILDAIAKQSGGDYQARMFEALDEKTQNVIDSLVSDFFGQVAKHTYNHLLPKAIFTIAQSDAVFVGRGVNLILPQAFHVRITASLDSRIKFFVEHEKLAQKDAEEKIKDADRQSDAFMKELARTVHVKYLKDEADVTISTDRISVDEAASIILHAFELFRTKHA